MNIEVITSFDQRYYDVIGKDSVQSWLQHWPNHMTLTCYVENMRLAEHPRIHQIDFGQLGSYYKNFQISNFSKGNLTSDIKFAILNKQNKNQFSLLKSLKISEGVSATVF